MRPHVVVDVGNSHIKWGLCAPDGSGILRSWSMADDHLLWDRHRIELRAEPALAGREGSLTWMLASVRPERSGRFAGWLRDGGERVEFLDRAGQLPLEVQLVHPDRAGIDRLLNAVAAKRRLPPGRPAVLVDAGSAVTVDWLDEKHAFRGGSIFPGLRLMAKALNDYAALLPLVTVKKPIPALPAGDTLSAMEAGIFHTVTGGIERIARHLAAQASTAPEIFVTGGDGEIVHAALGPQTPPRSGEGEKDNRSPSPFRGRGWGEGFFPAVLWPTQTLEGILFSAEAQSL